MLELSLPTVYLYATVAAAPESPPLLLLSSSPTVSAAVNRHARRLLLSLSLAEEREINPLCDYHCFLAYYLLVSLISILFLEFVPHFELNVSRSLS